jgi:hypothetical protein
MGAAKLGPIVLLCGSLAAFPLAAQAELWPKAVEAYARGKALKPGKASAMFREIDGEGKAKTVMTTEMKIRYDDKGIPAFDIVSMKRDGKDITEEVRRQSGSMGNQKEGRPGQGAQGDGSSGSGSPFGGMGIIPDETFPLDPLAQAAISLQPGASYLTQSGKKYAIIPFELKQGKTSLKGSLKAEAPSGAPVEISLDIPLPLPASGEFNYAYTFARFPSGAFVPSVQEYSGNAGFLLIRMKFEGKIELSEYK